MSTSEVTPDQQIRIAAVNAAALAYSHQDVFSSTLASSILKTAENFEKYIRGSSDEVQKVHIFSSPGEIWVENGGFPDLTGCEISIHPDLEKHTHLPQQHRDGKPPWCRACGRDKYGQKPTVVLGADKD